MTEFNYAIKKCKGTMKNFRTKVGHQKTIKKIWCYNKSPVTLRVLKPYAIIAHYIVERSFEDC